MKTVAFAALVACGAPAPKPDPSVPPRHAAITLTWLVYPTIPNPKDPDNLPVAPLELVIGGETIKLKPQLGSLAPYYQSVCPDVRGYGLERDEVAKITFTEGGAGGYLVKRTPRGLILMEWDHTHSVGQDPKTGALTDSVPRVKEVRLLPAPINARPVQQLMKVDVAGKQTPYDCRLD